MNYCNKGQLVVVMDTGQIGRVVHIINRRDHKRDGKVMVQCGAGGPYVEALMGLCREATGNEEKEFEGVIFQVKRPWL
jgi:hypothetical protein